MGNSDRPDGRGSDVDCEETLRELDRFLDDELSGDARHAIHHHLSGCVDCHQAFDFHAELKSVVAEKCNNDEMPAGLVDRLQQCLVTGDLVQHTDTADASNQRDDLAEDDV